MHKQRTGVCFLIVAHELLKFSSGKSESHAFWKVLPALDRRSRGRGAISECLVRSF